MIGLLVFAGVFVAMKWKKTDKKRMNRPWGPTPWLITGNLLPTWRRSSYNTNKIKREIWTHVSNKAGIHDSGSSVWH